jgi:hypothetical protein
LGSETEARSKNEEKSQRKDKVNNMEDYAEKTKSLISEISQDLITEKNLFVREININWKVQPINESEGNSIVSELVPDVNIKFLES